MMKKTFVIGCVIAMPLMTYCKSADGVYRETQATRDQRLEYQILDYDGNIYAISNNPGTLLRVENTSDLTFFNGTDYKKDPSRTEIVQSLKQPISFVPIAPLERHDFQRADLRGPFLFVTDQKGECTRYVLFAEPVDHSEKIKPVLRATQGRGNFPSDCASKLKSGFTYDVSDNAFGLVLIFDDSKQIVGVVVIGYMYGRPYITEGYPIEKAKPFFKKALGTAESIYE